MTIYQSVKYASLHKNIFDTLKKYSKQSNEADNLLVYLLIVRQKRRDEDLEYRPTQWRWATNQVLKESIDLLEEETQEHAQVLRLRFFDGHSVIKVGNMMNVADATVMRMQRYGLERLTKIIMMREEEARMKSREEILSKFHPPTYSKLFGVADAIEALQGQLTENSENWVVAVAGLGGIGKTSLSDYATRRVVEGFHYDDVVWVRLMHGSISSSSDTPKLTFEFLTTELAKHFFGVHRSPRFEDQLIQVRQRLNSAPHLVIIDNLEHEEDTAYILDQLRELADPSRFLITSRTIPESKSGVFTVNLEELPQDASIDLMRDYAATLGSKLSDEFTDEELIAVFRRVGGNPQALKLVVSLIDILPFDKLIEVLESGRARQVDKMYKHIYWQSWRTLDDDARTLLGIMPLVSETGGDAEYLQALAELEETDFWPAVQLLQRRSLVEVRGGVHKKKYGVHRLTETFVKNEIANWWEEADVENA